MKVSVIIPAYNEEKNISRAINSCKNQTYKNIEIIVVENGNSSDKTYRIAKELCLKIYSLKEANLAKARNYGAKKTKGDLLFFLDADSELSKNFILEIVKLRKNGLLIGKARLKPDKNKFRAEFVCMILNLMPTRFCGNMFIDKDFFQKLGEFNPEAKIPGEELAVRAKKLTRILITKNSVITSMRSFEKKGYFKYLYNWLKTSPNILIRNS